MRYLLLIMMALLTVAVPVLAERPDPHSFALPDEAAVKHLDLDIEVDFEARQIRGTAAWELERSADSTKLLLDTRGLDIRGVRGGGVELPFQLSESDPNFGRALTVQLPEGVERVEIDYVTSPDAAALQWLTPEQTAGKEHPFLFTQSQAILARTWLPCQDGPGVRFTYEATVKVPPELLAVMSAENPTSKNAQGIYTFSMPQAVPSYLMALAVGDLEFRDLGGVTGIYAEPSVLDAAAHEFAETQQMVDAVEPIYGPYKWGRYDMLVLPPSFPFGGMENPRLTFLTPTVIAGDRSLTALVAHELAHSWSGNLVTNATWNDFWLNEGFTVYIERRIMEAVYGKEYADMITVLGYADLLESLQRIHADDTHLKLDLAGRDPDDGLTDIAYEKGSLFLLAIERQVGRERFDDFLKKYFEEFAFQTVDTEEFLAYLQENLGSELPIHEWVYMPGIPVNFEGPTSVRFNQVDEQLEHWAGGAKPLQLAVDGWTTHEWLRFLRGLPQKISQARLAELDQAFGLTASGNSEIKTQWFLHAIRNDYRPAFDELQAFLTEVGRRKFLEPLYQELAYTEAGKQWALEVYRQARPNYHSVSVGTVDGLLGWSEAAEVAETVEVDSDADAEVDADS